MRRQLCWLILSMTCGCAFSQTRAGEPPAPARTSRWRLFDRFRREPAEVPPPMKPVTPEVPAVAPPSRPATDAPLQRTQATVGDMGMPLGPSLIPPATIGAQSLSLEAALTGALTGNPDLVSMRAGNVAGNVASPEAVEVARRFPTTLNPTLWVDVRPFVNERVPGGIGPDGRPFGPSTDHKDALLYLSIRQPLELGHQTRYRYAMAVAALKQQRASVLQAELLALVQTYRFFQTAAYRREKLHLAQQLADFNNRLVQSLRQRLEASQVAPDVVVLAEVENEATQQIVEVASQEYAIALTDLRNQIGSPETAGTAEPLGDFLLPAYIPEVEDQALILTALQNRPEIKAALAQVEGARAALALARGDRIPSPVLGPTYERDEAGTQFFGFVYITAIPCINNGTPLVRQREAEYRRACVGLEQVQKRTIAQVKAATAKWNSATRLVTRTNAFATKLNEQVANMEQLFDAGQTDVAKLLQTRQRLIQLENSRLDAIWQATQAQADLLTALGPPTLIEALDRSSSPTTPPLPLAPTPPVAGSPFTR